MRRSNLDNSKFRYRLPKKLFFKYQAYLNLIETLRIIPDIGLIPLASYYTAGSAAYAQLDNSAQDGYLIAAKKKDTYENFARILITKKCYQLAEYLLKMIFCTDTDRDPALRFSSETIRLFDMWLSHPHDREIKNTFLLTLKANASTRNGEYDAYSQLNRMANNPNIASWYKSITLEEAKHYLQIVYYSACCHIGISPADITADEELKNIPYKNLINISDTTLAAIPDIPQLAAICSLNKNKYPNLTSPRGAVYLQYVLHPSAFAALPYSAMYYKTSSNTKSMRT